MSEEEVKHKKPTHKVVSNIVSGVLGGLILLLIVFQVLMVRSSTYTEFGVPSLFGTSFMASSYVVTLDYQASSDDSRQLLEALSARANKYLYSIDKSSYMLTYLSENMAPPHKASRGREFKPKPTSSPAKKQARRKALRRAVLIPFTKK